MRRPKILVVDDDRALLRLVRTGLELEGCTVIEATTLAEAAAALDDRIDGVVLDRRLPDGDGLGLFAVIHTNSPTARVVVHTSCEVPDGVRSASKGDVDAILDELHLREAPPADGVTDVALRAASGLREIWLDLCRHDPALPPGAEPPLAGTVVAALTDAFLRPQPLGRLDLALAPIMHAFASAVDSPEDAVAMLGCLREAWTQAGVEGATVREREGISYRMNLIIDRMMVAAAKAATGRLSEQALTDPLTGLGNRRAFDRALERETARAARHGRPMTLVMIDLDGLKRVNDTLGHAAGDTALLDLAAALRTVLRTEDSAYRLGGDEFAVVLADAVVLDVGALEERIRAAGAPPITLGIASTPPDDPQALAQLADARLYQRRYERR